MVSHVTRVFAGLVITSSALLGATASSLAGHGSCSSSLSISFHGGSWGHRQHGCSTRRSYVERQYEEGYALGSCHGEREGFHDGFHGHVFCDDPRIRLGSRSRHFCAGYEDGYACAYDRAYHEGECARRSSHRRHFH
jgi:hypothetical protein